jgi:hypothetical protein
MATQTLQFNGITIGLGGNYHLETIEGLLLGNIEFNSYLIPQTNASKFVSNYIKSKIITIDVGIRGDDLADFYVKRKALLNAVYPKANQSIEFTYTTDEGDIYVFNGVLRGAPSENTRSGAYQVLGFSFYIPNGQIKGNILNSQTLSQAGVATGAVLPWTLPVLLGAATGGATISNAGNGYAPINITITGPGTNFTILNQTTGESLAIENLTLIAGQTIEIDGTNQTVKQAGVSIYQYVSATSTFINLAPGNNNLAFYVGSGATSQTQAVITWYNTYVGI